MGLQATGCIEHMGIRASSRLCTTMNGNSALRPSSAAITHMVWRESAYTNLHSRTSRVLTVQMCNLKHLLGCSFIDPHALFLSHTLLFPSHATLNKVITRPESEMIS